MAIRGPKPKDPSQLRSGRGGGGGKDWTEVVDEPYSGSRPALPRKRTIMVAGQRTTEAVLPATREWWKAIGRMPHCALWSAGDWQFALTTAYVADMAFRGSVSAASELRNRERVLGTTYEFRRDLRIRYVEPRPALAVVHVAEEDFSDL